VKLPLMLTEHSIFEKASALAGPAISHWPVTELHVAPAAGEGQTFDREQLIVEQFEVGIAAGVGGSEQLYQ